MGILNVTPDSFYDGGQWLGDAAIARFDELVEEGAGIVDVGGESTRPGAPVVPANEQIARIEPVLKHAVLARKGVLVSVDTCDPAVAEYALQMGAHAINDVSCLANPAIARVAAAKRSGLIIMHARGPMSNMPGFSATPESDYEDVVLDIVREWRAAQQKAISAGMPSEDLVFDPGIGFWKSARHSLDVLRRIGEFDELKVPIMIGASRKSFLTLVQKGSPDQRLGGSLAASLYAARQGVHIVRVHDVAVTRQALLLQRILNRLPDELTNVGENAMEGAC